MRRYLIAAAVAGGILLLGGAPAHADDLTPPAAGQGDLLGGVVDPALGGLNPSDGVRVESPMGERPLLDVKPNTNVAPTNKLPAESKPRTGLGDARVLDQHPRSATDALPTGQLPTGQLPALGELPGLGNLPLVGGLTSNGLPIASNTPLTGGRQAAAESGLLGGNLPMIAGLLPDGPVTTLPADADDDADDVSGLPQGGTDVPATTPGDTPPPNAAGPGDDRQRLHEEPIDDEASNERPFSDGRPVAGEDPDFR